jgi:hypothetical protein
MVEARSTIEYPLGPSDLKCGVSAVNGSAYDAGGGRSRALRGIAVWLFTETLERDMGLRIFSSETCDLSVVALRPGRSRFCEIAQNELLFSGLYA